MEELNETNTAVDAPNKLKEQLGRLSEEALRICLENWGYQVNDGVTKSELIEAVSTRHVQLIKESEELVKKATEDSEDVDDPIVDIVFENIESPGTEIEFCFQPPKGTLKVVNGKVRPAPKWKFYPGRKYQVPLSIYNHLNSLKVPADKKVNTDERGFVRSLYSGDDKQNRFACRLELSNEQIRRLKE